MRYRSRRRKNEIQKYKLSNRICGEYEIRDFLRERMLMSLEADLQAYKEWVAFINCIERKRIESDD